MDTCEKNEYALMSRPELIAILKITPAARSVNIFASAKSSVVLLKSPQCTGRPSLYSRSTRPLSENLCVLVSTHRGALMRTHGGA